MVVLLVSGSEWTTRELPDSDVADASSLMP